ncbi:MAG: hypothetical protein WD114_00445 [Phycisphaerales bacterium]
MQDLLHNLTAHEAFVPMFFIFGVGGMIAVIAIVLGMIKEISVSRDREKSRREVAAYVAEGSMTPEDAERILRVGTDRKG